MPYSALEAGNPLTAPRVRYEEFRPRLIEHSKTPLSMSKAADVDQSSNWCASPWVFQKEALSVADGVLGEEVDSVRELCGGCRP